jgi:mycofactocin precursor
VDGTLPQMEQETVVDAAGEQHESAVEADDELLDELLIEEISIDGMCGVY